MDWEPFSVRQRRLERQDQPVIYRYDELPYPFRVQVMRILEDVIGEQQGHIRSVSANRGNELSPSFLWNAIWRHVSYELGLSTGGSGGHSDFLLYLFKVPDVTVLNWLDAIEIAFRTIQLLPLEYTQRYDCALSAEQAIAELNKRFQRHALGYALQEGILVRIDSQFVHAEIVRPALHLLNTAGFEGAQGEFLSAHEHFRHGRNEEAIGDALKAFESTMKHICDRRDWAVSADASAKDLIKVVTNEGLFPKSLESYLNSLRTIMEVLPTIRNKNAAHGTGTNKRQVPDAMAAYALHLSASNIVFLVESFKLMP